MNTSSLIAAADAAAARRDFAGAVHLLGQATRAEPGNADVLKKVAACERALGRPAEALAAITAALAIDPRDPISLLVKGSLIEAEGGDAEEPYRAALAFLPDDANLPPPLRDRVAQVRRYCDAAAGRRAERLGGIAQRAAVSLSLSAAERGRIEDFVDALVAGQATTVLPGLSRPAFFPPAAITGLVDVARAHRHYTTEYLAMAGRPDLATPYVDHPAGVPLDQWAALNRSDRWSAAHLWRGGAVVDEVASRCPETMAAFATLPTPAMRGRSPNLMFSVLAPRTHIPPHTGVLNARLVCHVPLIVPADCSITVADETRGWTPGEALVFDDTLPHEAVNDSDETRVVLIGDAWHPDLSANERTVLTALLDDS